MAIRRYFRSTRGPSDIILSYDRSLLPGYGWIIPVGGDEYNIGCGITWKRMDNGRHSLKKRLEDFLSGFPPADELLRHGEPVSPVYGASLRYSLFGVTSAVSGPVVAIGETIGTTFPMTGEGIGKAMYSGELAAEAIANALSSGNLSRLEEYRQSIDRLLKPCYRGYEVAERWLSYAWLNDFVAHRVGRSRFLRAQLRELTLETGDPRKLFSPISVIKSYVQ